MKPAVSVNDVTKRYGEVEALKSATFSVNPGELFGIIGRTEQVRALSSGY